MTGHPYVTTTRAGARARASAGASAGDGDGAGADVDRDDRLVITTDRGQLHYADLRKLRGVWIVEGDAAAVAAVIGEQGPDALDIRRRPSRWRCAAAGVR